MRERKRVPSDDRRKETLVGKGRKSLRGRNETRLLQKGTLRFRRTAKT